MDQTAGDIQNKKKELEAKLVKTLLTASEEDKISYQEMKRAADYILDHIDSLKNDQALSNFTKDLAHFWPIFQGVELVENQDERKEQEQAVINKLSHYVKNYSPKDG